MWYRQMLPPPPPLAPTLAFLFMPPRARSLLKLVGRAAPRRLRLRKILMQPDVLG